MIATLIYLQTLASPRDAVRDDLGVARLRCQVIQAQEKLQLLCLRRRVDPPASQRAGQAGQVGYQFAGSLGSLHVRSGDDQNEAIAGEIANQRNVA